MSDYYTPAATLEEDFVNLVRLELNDIKKTFFRIGFRLHEANRNKYYKKLGYNTIEECAEALFGFKKTTTYDLMNVYVAFADSKAPMMLDEKYKDFSQSQLVLFSSINYGRAGFISRARPEDTIEKLKKAKRYWKEFMLRGVSSNGSYVSYSKTKTIDELIDLYEKHALVAPSATPDKAPDSNNFSGYPEKSEEPAPSEGKIVLDVPESEVHEVAEDVPDETPVENEDQNVLKQKELRKNMLDLCGKRLEFMNYKTIFDPENKGLGVRVPADHVAGKVFSNQHDYITKNRTAVKNTLKQYLSERIGAFSYEITLCGRKQGISPFCGNVSDYVIDFILDTLVPGGEKK